MASTSLISLCGAMWVLAASPGPGVFVTGARSLSTGFNSSLPVIVVIVIRDIAYLAERARQAIYNTNFQKMVHRSAGAMMISAGVWVAP